MEELREAAAATWMCCGLRIETRRKHTLTVVGVSMTLWLGQRMFSAMACCVPSGEWSRAQDLL